MSDDATRNPDRSRRAQALFERAWKLPPGEREVFVRQQAGDEEDLAEEVLAILHDMEAQTAVRDRSAPRPQQIGPYRILDELGEGGMGTVYLAEQSTPVKRRVALKLIKLGMDSKAVLSRFEQERQALALMS
ncbi:MAG: serine/threonine protein kinase, partial [Planctomycetota bacterium]